MYYTEVRHRSVGWISSKPEPKVFFLISSAISDLCADDCCTLKVWCGLSCLCSYYWSVKVWRLDHLRLLATAVAAAVLRIRMYVDSNCYIHDPQQCFVLPTGIWYEFGIDEVVVSLACAEHFLSYCTTYDRTYTMLFTATREAFVSFQMMIVIVGEGRTQRPVSHMTLLYNVGTEYTFIRCIILTSSIICTLRVYIPKQPWSARAESDSKLSCSDYFILFEERRTCIQRFDNISSSQSSILSSSCHTGAACMCTAVPYLLPCGRYVALCGNLWLSNVGNELPSTFDHCCCK